MTRFWECPTLKPSMTDTYSLHFDTADLWRDTYHQMREIEDAVTIDAVIQYLRDQGYTVAAPGG